METENGLVGNTMRLSKRTMDYLGVKDGDKVILCAACGFGFLWYNPDVSKRYAFRIAVVAFGVATVSSVLSCFF